MLSRLSPAIRTALSASRAQVTAVRCMGYHADVKTDAEIAKIHGSTLNDLPVPAGSWKEDYNKNNTKYNIQLGLSALFLITTYFVMVKTNVTLYHEVKDFRKLNIDPSKPIE